MGAREELEEDGAVDGEVASHTKRPEGGEAADGGEVGRAGGDHAEDRGHAESQVEGPAPPEDVAAEAPEHGADEQAYVLAECQQRGALGAEFVGDGREDQRGDDRPEVVAGPAEADYDEELPLIPSHANVLDLGKCELRSLRVRDRLTARLSTLALAS